MGLQNEYRPITRSRAAGRAFFHRGGPPYKSCTLTSLPNFPSFPIEHQIHVRIEYTEYNRVQWLTPQCEWPCHHNRRNDADEGDDRPTFRTDNRVCSTRADH